MRWERKTIIPLICLLFLATTAAGLNFVQAQVEDVLWDGEVADAASLVFDYGTAVTHDVYQGSLAFEGVPDQWHQPAISLQNLPAWRKDISSFDEIRFYAKASAPGKTINFSVYGWPHTSRIVPVNLSTAYQLIKIPLSDLKTADYNLSSIEILYFGTAAPTVGHKIYIDNVTTVKLSEPTPAPPPPPPSPLPSPPQVRIGAITSSSVEISWAPVPTATQTNIYLAPEPTANNPSVPKQLMASLGNGATSYRLANLAAGTDFFLRVEAVTPAGVVGSEAHARTPGGPRVNLDTPVRQVFGYAPNVLMLVLEDKVLLSNRGPTWQKGPWSVTRRDGRILPVMSVYRRSVPVSQPGYELGFGAPVNNNLVEVDHEIYLVLAEPIGAADVLNIAGPLNLNFILPFSDRYLATPVIQLNQVGYSPRSAKRWAYVSGWMGDGGALSLNNFPSLATVLAEPNNPNDARPDVLTNLAVTSRFASDSDAGGEVRQIDLSALPADANRRYRVRLPGVGVSWLTQVSESAVFEAFFTVARGLYHNRWGGDLASRYTAWSRPADHPLVYTGDNLDFNSFYPANTPKTGARPLAGGYHDAADFDQRPMHTLVPELLMRAYELNRQAFNDSQLNLPESGNNIPDILDEALWGIAGWEQLQESDGGVRLGVESSQHPNGYYFANQDPLSYWTYGREPNHTARVAGLFAQAARLLAPFAPGRADTLKNRAAKAWFYALANNANHANVLYASGELYRLTGQLIYKAAFERAWNAMGPYGAFSNFASNQFYLGDYSSNNRAMPDYLLGYLQSPEADANIRATTFSWLDNYARQAKENVLNSSRGHRSPRPAGTDPDWGNGVMTGKFMDTIYARLQLGGLSAAERAEYFDALSLAADYMLGGNPDGRVYFTGLGTKSVQEPLHLDSLAFIKTGQGPIPGLPVFGPVSGLPDADYYKPGAAAFYPAFFDQPLMRRYADVRPFVTTNEFSVWEAQAPAVEHLAVLLGLNLMPAPLPPPAPTVDAALPAVSLFAIQPRSGLGPVVAEFIASDSGGSFLDRVELNRASFDPLNCNDIVKIGCVWDSYGVKSAPANANLFTGTLTDRPPSGTYFYGLHAIDKAGNRGIEPAVIKVIVGASTPIPSPTPGEIPPEEPPTAPSADTARPTLSTTPPGGGGGGGTPFRPPATPENIKPEAETISHGSREAVAVQVGQNRSEAREAEVNRSVVSRILTKAKEVAPDSRVRVLNFVSYGTPLTEKLGVGERAGVVNSFQESFGRLPESEGDWAHVIKIAAGRWPDLTNKARESAVEPSFRSVYLRSPNRANPHDDAAMVIMAYGVRPKPRNLDNEKTAIKIFNAIFRRLPATATAWDIVRAIAYSGATR
ncbi:MAG: glycoside hydrolase family 9 protein [Parcubacteria group bacterium]|nr:glycoside hydrolase family 9 protein [Parcubacteria group bacterium]